MNYAPHIFFYRLCSKRLKDVDDVALEMCASCVLRTRTVYLLCSSYGIPVTGAERRGALCRLCDLRVFERRAWQRQHIIRPCRFSSALIRKLLSRVGFVWRWAMRWTPLPVRQAAKVLLGYILKVVKIKTVPDIRYVFHWRFWKQDCTYEQTSRFHALRIQSWKLCKSLYYVFWGFYFLRQSDTKEEYICTIKRPSI